MSKKPTIHTVALAHLPVVAEDPVYACAFTGKARRFQGMMKAQGYKTILYCVEGSKTEADEQVVCLSEDARNKYYGPLNDFANKFYEHGRFDPANIEFNKNAVREISERVQPKDIVNIVMGNYQSTIACSVANGGVEIANGTPFLVEGGVGYSGIMPETCHQVFESYAWEHYLYGMYSAWSGGKQFINGDFYNTVIPNYYNVGHYKFNESREPFFLMNCRIATRKGINIAIKTCEATGDHLILAGQPGEAIPELDSLNAQYIGYVTEAEKIELMSRAKGLFSPSIYIEPFGGVAVEAMMSGCPVIATDFGAYTETIKEGVTGFRCNTLREFVHAARHIDEISPQACRDFAVSNFSTEVCGKRYDKYFGRLSDLWKKGWGELE